MKLSYEAIGQWCATFACSGVTEGKTVKLSASGTVGACAAGDDFTGIAAFVARSGDACSVQLGGMVTVPYTGTTAPAVGWETLAADGTGGVKAVTTGGRSYLVAAVDTTAKTVTFVL